MKTIKSLWKKFVQEVRLWRDEKKQLAKGIFFGTAVCWLFYDRIFMIVFMIPFVIPWMKWQRKKERLRQREQMKKEFREMILSVGNSLSVGYSLENAIRAAKEDLQNAAAQETGLLRKELDILISSMRVNEPVEHLLGQMADHLELEEMHQFAEITSIVKKNGGNLIEIIGRTAEHLSQSMQLQEEIRTVTAQKQLEKKIMSWMPYFMIAYVRISNPGYFQILYESIPGKILATVALAVLFGAGLWAERVVMIEI
jgi:tight adherence protein B